MVAAHGLSCSEACGIFLDWESNPCLLHQPANSLPLSHQGNPATSILQMRLREAHWLALNRRPQLQVQCSVHAAGTDPTQT